MRVFEAGIGGVGGAGSEGWCVLVDGEEMLARAQEEKGRLRCRHLLYPGETLHKSAILMGDYLNLADLPPFASGCNNILTNQVGMRMKTYNTLDPEYPRSERHYLILENLSVRCA